MNFKLNIFKKAKFILNLKSFLVLNYFYVGFTKFKAFFKTTNLKFSLN